MKIAQTAADTIEKGYLITLGSATKTNQIAELMHDKENSTLITNDL